MENESLFLNVLYGNCSVEEFCFKAVVSWRKTGVTMF